MVFSSTTNSSFLNLLKSSILTQSIDVIDSVESIDSADSSSSLKAANAFDDNDYYSNDAAMIAQKILNLLKVKEDTKLLQATVVSLGIFLIVIGIVLNFTFNIITIVRRRYTASCLIMVSMCTAYLIYLILYCFKLTVYLKDISKYHIYDTIQEWEYGLFMCQFINAFLVTCKLISRFSILALCINRITILLEAKNTIEKFFNHHHHHQNDSSPESSTTGDRNSKILNFFMKLFNLPFILFLIFTIWFASLLMALPVFLSYKLSEVNNSTTVLCDSIYSFPDDTGKYALNTFNYMIFGLIIPSILIMTSIGAIFAIQCVYDLSINEKVKSQANFLPLVLFTIHFITTLPSEIYKYSRLSTIKQEVLLDSSDLYVTASLIEKNIIETISNPVTSAKPYYYLQYLYISEFIMIPIVLLTFYILSTKRVSNFCSIYLKCFDCREKEDELTTKKLFNNQNSGYKAAKIENDFLDDTKRVKVSTASSTEHHHVTRSLLKDDKMNNEHEDLNEDNVRTIVGSGRIKIIRKTSASSNACSTNTTSSGSNDLLANRAYNNYKPK